MRALLLALTLACRTAERPGHADPVEVLAPTPDRTCADARAALAGIEPRWCRSYEETVDFLFLALDRDEAGEVECVYTGRRIVVAARRPDPALFDTEHTWPQSRGSGAMPARCDLHHLYPTAASANRARGNLPFGEVVGGVTWSEGGSRRGVDRAGRRVFEPRDRHKGDVARAMLYVAERYDVALPEPERALYLRWHALDPVDADELRRTLAIAGVQDVPNPFVVCPELVDEARP